MNQATMRILLEGNRRLYQPGDLLSGTYQVESPKSGGLHAVEISVLWRTEGQGDEDLAVHHFERIDADDKIDFRRPQPFSTALPSSPLSYQGVIVKICWCVRVRAFLSRGKEIVGEVPFQLGSLPPVRLTKPAAPVGETSSELPAEGPDEV